MIITMTKIYKIFVLVFIFIFWGCQVEDLVLKPPRANCGKIVGFWDKDYTQEMGNPCWEGRIDVVRPSCGNCTTTSTFSVFLKRELPGNGDYGIVVVNDISGNEKTFCVNSYVWYRKTSDNKFSGLGSIYCTNDFRSW